MAVLTTIWNGDPASGTEERRPTKLTQEQKIIRAKLGLLELAKQLGNSLPSRKRGSAKPAR